MMDKQAVITQVRAAWPAYQKNHGRQDGHGVPPVRDGGNTAALIDLAVTLALAARNDELERLREDLDMYERLSEQSPTREIECSNPDCDRRYQVRIIDHEISAPVQVMRPSTATIPRWHLTSLEFFERAMQALCEQLSKLCVCDHNPETTDGPQQDCVLHGDGETFVAWVRYLEGVRRTAVKFIAEMETSPEEDTLGHLRAYETLKATTASELFGTSPWAS